MVNNKNLLHAMPCKIHWTRVKGHQIQGQREKCKLDVESNIFCDKKDELVRMTQQDGDMDPFLDQHMASYGREKDSWGP